MSDKTQERRFRPHPPSGSSPHPPSGSPPHPPSGSLPPLVETGTSIFICGLKPEGMLIPSQCEKREDEAKIGVNDEVQRNDVAGVDIDRADISLGHVSAALESSIEYPTEYAMYRTTNVPQEIYNRTQCEKGDRATLNSITIDGSASVVPQHNKRSEPLGNRNAVHHLMDTLTEATDRAKAERRCRRNCFRFFSVIMLVAIGICTGLTAVFVAVFAGPLGEWKGGGCATNILARRRDCCANARIYQPDNTTDPSQISSWKLDCPQWTVWSTNYSGAYVLYLLVGIACVMFAHLLVKKFAPGAAGSGVNEINAWLQGWTLPNFLTGRVLAVKTIGLIFATTILQAGKEGPLVYVGAAWAYIITSLARSRITWKSVVDKLSEREFIASAAAAGIAAAFGAPLGGVAYVLESTGTRYSPKLIAMMVMCSVSAVITVYLCDPWGQGLLVEYEFSTGGHWGVTELFPILLLGLLCGVSSGAIKRLNWRYIKWRTRQPWLSGHAWFEVLLVATVTALVHYPIPITRVGMLAQLETLFSECPDLTTADGRQFTFVLAASPLVVASMCTADALGATIFLLLLASIANALLQVVTMTLKVPAGLFVPSMSVGALLGRGFGLIVKIVNNHGGDGQLVFAKCSTDAQCVSAATYAVLGAIGVLAGVTGMQFSLAVIAFELSPDVTQLVPIVICIISSNFVGSLIMQGSIYDWLALAKKIPIFFISTKSSAKPASHQPASDQPASTLSDRPISEFMTRNLSCLYATGETIGSIWQLVHESEEMISRVSSLRETDLHEAKAIVQTNFRGFPVLLRRKPDQAKIRHTVDGNISHTFNVTSDNACGYVTREALLNVLATHAFKRSYKVEFAPSSSHSSPSLSLSTESTTTIQFTASPEIDARGNAVDLSDIVERVLFIFFSFFFRTVSMTFRYFPLYLHVSRNCACVCVCVSIRRNSMRRARSHGLCNAFWTLVRATHLS
jgi:H+/Cl- antiporter ClcA